ncbi:uncharacterized protein VTP21DRAFT_7878 [Calcarisporiella thermophila]|uniref:uncharacterized protein n=1 Tax=Calcarisporiella thermophila TaxID=911321 RepID=UPI00374478EB
MYRASLHQKQLNNNQQGNNKATTKLTLKNLNSYYVLGVVRTPEARLSELGVKCDFSCLTRNSHFSSA